MMFQPFFLPTGYAAMNASTSVSLISCSKELIPGDFDPSNHSVMEARTDSWVYFGSVPIAQSPESDCQHNSRFDVRRDVPRFQTTVSRPNTPFAIALTRLSTSPKGGRQYRGIRPPLRSEMSCIVHPSSLRTSSLDMDVMY
jgi:hypothetical protein